MTIEDVHEFSKDLACQIGAEEHEDRDAKLVVVVFKSKDEEKLKKIVKNLPYGEEGLQTCIWQIDFITPMAIINKLIEEYTSLESFGAICHYFATVYMTIKPPTEAQMMSSHTEAANETAH